MLAHGEHGVHLACLIVTSNEVLLLLRFSARFGMRSFSASGEGACFLFNALRGLFLDSML